MKKVIRLNESELLVVIKNIVESYSPLMRLKRRFNIHSKLNSPEFNELYEEYKKFRDEGNSHDDIWEYISDTDIPILVLDFLQQEFENEEDENDEVKVFERNGELTKIGKEMNDFILYLLEEKYKKENFE